MVDPPHAYASNDRQRTRQTAATFFSCQLRGLTAAASDSASVTLAGLVSSASVDPRAARYRAARGLLSGGLPVRRAGRAAGVSVAFRAGGTVRVRGVRVAGRCRVVAAVFAGFVLAGLCRMR